jgi:creatinine amidohydrolase
MKTNLAISHDPSFWPFFTWTEFAGFKDRDKRVVIIPVAGMNQWHFETPLDFEECVALSVLRKALASATDPTQFLVVPPVRFTIGRKAHSYFTVDIETAHQTLQDIVTSIQQQGFRKVLFFNANPWSEPLVDAAGRDLRISLGVQPFCINLSSLGLNLMSDSSDPSLEHLRDFIYGTNPDNKSKGSHMITTAAEELFSLIMEVHAFCPLANDGNIPQKTFPE